MSIENVKILISIENVARLSIICSNYGNEDEKISKEEESIETLKILGLIENL